jgi:hypothetical protein
MNVIPTLREIFEARGKFVGNRFESSDAKALLKDLAAFVDSKYHEWEEDQNSAEQLPAEPEVDPESPHDEYDPERGNEPEEPVEDSESTDVS